MATFNKLPTGRWRVQVRRKSQQASRTFRLKDDAEQWARQTEEAVEAGRSINAPVVHRRTPFSKLIDLHLADLNEVGKPPLRSKRYTLENLKRDLGDTAIVDLHRECLITFGKHRAKEGAGPVTVSMEIGYIRTILIHAAAVHGINVSTESVTLARVALKRLGLVGKGRERDRRPTIDELNRIIAYCDGNNRQMIPVGRLVKFAVATAMREGELCALLWRDIDFERCLALVRDRKDPRQKVGNDQKVPLLDATGYDAVALLHEQRALLPTNGDRVFPYNSRSLGTAFRRACRELKIDDLHFHDLRHEATSRLFEAGYDIPEVALVTGHKDWKMLQRYLNLKPHQLLHRTTLVKRY